MKRVCILFLTVVLTVSLFTGCEQRTTDPANAPSESAPETSSVAQTTESSALATTSAPPAVQEKQLYADYLRRGGYAALMATYGDADSNIEAEACLADFNGDGIRELLLHLTDKASALVRGFYAVTVLLGVQNGVVEQLGFAEYGGGSGGGNYILVKYDTLEKKHVLVYEEFVRDGMFANALTHYFFDMTQRDTEEKELGLAGSDGMVYKTAHTLRCDYFAEDGAYAQDAARIKRETDLFSQPEEGGVIAYRYDDAYVSETDYDALQARFAEPTDPDYQMQPVTLQNPIPA